MRTARTGTAAAYAVLAVLMVAVIGFVFAPIIAELANGFNSVRLSLNTVVSTGN